MTRFSIAVLFAAAAAASMPIIDNDRVTAWDVTAGDPYAPQHAGDTMWISLSRPGEVAFKAAGQKLDVASLGGRAIAIDLKDKKVEPLANTSGYPSAFPRPGVKKLFENARVVVWDYSWQTRVPSPMHFHDKDVVVVYVETGALKSTTLDGQSTLNEFTAGTVRFNTRNRVHTELMTSEHARAIICELK
jgi:hypothetical protein